MTSQTTYPVVGSLPVQDADARRDLYVRTNPASDGPGAPPSNTAPANCSDGGDRPPGIILWSGLDSLYVSYRGRLLGDIQRKLDRKKEAAASLDPLDGVVAQLDLLGDVFQVAPHGRGKFRYLLLGDEYEIQLSDRVRGVMPVAYCKVYSHCLLSVGAKSAAERLEQLLGLLIESDGYPTVSRCDLTVDAAEPFDLDQLTKSDWICRSDDIPDHGGVTRRTGFSFGPGGDISARVYDKTLEIKKSKKEYMKTVWHEAGWVPTQRVIRTEFQLRSTVLRDLGYGPLPRLIADPGAVWRYCTANWLRLAIPDPSDNTRSRWETHPGWRLIAEFGFTGKSVATRQIPAKKVPQDETLFSRHVSAISGWMAKYNITDPEEAADDILQRCASHHDSRMFIREEGFLDHVKRKAAYKARMWNKRFGDTLDRDAEATEQAEKTLYQRTKRNQRDKSDDWDQDWDVDIPGLDGDQE